MVVPHFFLKPPSLHGCQVTHFQSPHFVGGLQLAQSLLNCRSVGRSNRRQSADVTGSTPADARPACMTYRLSAGAGLLASKTPMQTTPKRLRSFTNRDPACAILRADDTGGVAFHVSCMCSVTKSRGCEQLIVAAPRTAVPVQDQSPTASKEHVVWTIASSPW